VDEGQDFKVSYWVTIEEMLERDGIFYIFYDPDQNLYSTEMQFPISDKPFVLNTNCRNTVRICREVKKHTKGKILPMKGLPQGEPIVTINLPHEADRRRELGKILHKLINVEKVPRQRVVVLGGHSIEHTCLGENRKVGNFVIEHEPQPGKNTIAYYSYMRFKGCEADVVILLDVDLNDKRWKEPLAMYTALSRAKVQVYVLTK
jgi:hypothetical protein